MVDNLSFCRIKIMQLRMMELDSVKSMGLLSLHPCLYAFQCQRGRSDSVCSLSTIGPHSPCERDACMEDACVGIRIFN